MEQIFDPMIGKISLVLASVVVLPLLGRAVECSGAPAQGEASGQIPRAELTLPVQHVDADTGKQVGSVAHMHREVEAAGENAPEFGRLSVSLSALGAEESLLVFDLPFAVRKIVAGDGGVEVASPLDVRARSSAVHDTLVCAVSGSEQVCVVAQQEAQAPTSWCSSPTSESILAGLSSDFAVPGAWVLALDREAGPELQQLSCVDGQWLQVGATRLSGVGASVLGCSMLESEAGGGCAVLSLKDGDTVPRMQIFAAGTERAILSMHLPVELTAQFEGRVQVESIPVGDSFYIVVGLARAFEGTGAIVSIRLMDGIVPQMTILRGDSAMYALERQAEAPNRSAPGPRVERMQPNRFDFMGGFGRSFALSSVKDEGFEIFTAAPDIVSGARLFRIDAQTSRFISSAPLFDRGWNPRARVGMLLALNERTSEVLLSSSVVLVAREEQRHYADVVRVEFP